MYGVILRPNFILTDVEGPWCLVALKLEYEEVAGLTVMAEPQGHS